MAVREWAVLSRVVRVVRRSEHRSQSGCARRERLTEWGARMRRGKQVEERAGSRGWVVWVLSTAWKCPSSLQSSQRRVGRVALMKLRLLVFLFSPR